MTSGVDESRPHSNGGPPLPDGASPIGARFHSFDGGSVRPITFVDKPKPATGSFDLVEAPPLRPRASQADQRTGRWRLQNWRLRSRLALLLLIPLALAGILGGLRIAASVGDAQDLADVERQVALSQRVSAVIDALQSERHLAAAAAATGSPDQASLVDDQVQQVDGAVEEMLQFEANPDSLGPAPDDAYTDVLLSIDTLPELREQVSAPGTGVDLVIDRYREVIDTMLRFNRVALAGTNTASLSLAAGIGYLADAKDQLSVQHAVLLAASLTNEVTSVQASQLRTADAAYDSAIRNFSESIPSMQRQIYFSAVTGNASTDRERLLLIGLGEWPTFVPLDSIPQEWDETTNVLSGQLLEVETSLSDDLATATGAASDDAVSAAIRDATIVAILLALAVLLLVFVSRSVLRPLRVLRASALDIAQRRLPGVVERLQQPGGWREDIAPEPIPVHTREDIGEVARAFDVVHSQAVMLASEQAMMRGNVNDMFVNLSRRSQTLVERQLQTIDSLERGERDPAALGELFRLDHLATRMRRNNENLLVLAGSETRQRVGSARLVLDVLRGAISEIEEYPRITIEGVPTAYVRGIAVNDLVHLVAELLDNATSFSPDAAQVVLASSLQTDGSLLIEVRDSGVGMSATQRKAINDRLAEPPVVDVSVSRQMGLFVVGRLAARHAINVRVQVSGPDGGLTAMVSVPSALISSDASPQSPPRTPSDNGVAVGGDPSRNGSVLEPVGTASLFAADAGSTQAFGPVDPGMFAPPATNGEAPYAAAAATSGQPGGPPASPTSATESMDIFAAALGGAYSTTEAVSETPIFQEMRSAWFRQHRSDAVAGVPDAAPAPAAAPTPEPGRTAPPAVAPAPLATAEFSSSADEGWQAVEQLRTPVDAGVTEAGLPRRRPQALLMPGATTRPGMDAGSAGGRADAPRLRDAARVRGTLSSYQRGARRGRHSSEAVEETNEDAKKRPVGSHAEPTPARERQ